MEDQEKYRRWMLRARGIREAPDDEVEEFRQRVLRHRPYGSNLRLIKILRMDSHGDFAGTRAYLLSQGLDEPAQEDLAYFHRRIRAALVWRGSVGAAIVAALWYFLWLARVLPFR